ncbi:BAG family molecular chaperone regulator 5, mitochondrial [Oryza brachyantha]|uniref:BAG family molecular chaperone regulator 5, mitochondrial n=1 Tax=Oryza brachyantha TaxID=4533 RepID=UPI001ADB298D|nr:BAG family molecular chaperone regulator 5, mitochondrial [Oryza brachyantha]
MGSYHYTSTSRFFFAGDGEGEFSSYKGTSTTNTHRPTTVRIPVASPAPERSPDDAAAARIQAAFRGHLVRRHSAAVRAADAEATRLERLLRRQETVDAVRGDERERARFSEALMAVLLRLDAVPGYYPAVREARRAVTRRVVGLQEVFDAVLAAPAADAWGVPASLDQVLEGIWGCAGETPAAPPPVVVEEEEEVRRSPYWKRFFGGV